MKQLWQHLGPTRLQGGSLASRVACVHKALVHDSESGCFKGNSHGQMTSYSCRQEARQKQVSNYSNLIRGISFFKFNIESTFSHTDGKGQITVLDIANILSS